MRVVTPFGAIKKLVNEFAYDEFVSLPDKV
jgi:hypothetical protein